MATCFHPGQEINQDFWFSFDEKIKTMHIPLVGSLDLTYQCNLDCLHCYLPNKKSLSLKKEELTTCEWKSYIDQITQAGCLYLLLTGGEPFLRHDFIDIYLHAKRNGLLVTVFSNGTLLTEDIINVFSQYPPQSIEISLYGATASVYEKITGVKNSFNRCLHSIHWLIKAGLRVKLKTLLMSLNSHQIELMEKMARDLKVPFRFDASIFPRLNGDVTPIQWRIPAQEAVTKEFAEKDRLYDWLRFYSKAANIPQSEYLFQCGAGRTSFHINAGGNLQPCVMTPNHKYNLKNSSFLAGWQQYMPEVRALKPRRSDFCHRCSKRVLCGFCPGFFYLENHAEDVRSEYLCAIGNLRYEEMKRLSPGGLHEEKIG